MRRLMLVVLLLLLLWPLPATAGTAAPGHDRISAYSGDAAPTALRPTGVHETLLRTLGGAPDRPADPAAGRISRAPRAPASVLAGGLCLLAPADPEECIPLCEQLPFYPTAPPLR